VNGLLASIAPMLRGHAQHENNSLHKLLKEKNSLVWKKVEADHACYDITLDRLSAELKCISEEGNTEIRVWLGYNFYLSFRKFVGDNLLHMHEEELLILPVLHALYTDAELKTVDAAVYCEMTVVQMVEMMEILFPHMNMDDKLAFLTDIKDAQPEKFTDVWRSVKYMFNAEESAIFSEKLEVDPNEN